VVCGIGVGSESNDDKSLKYIIPIVFIFDKNPNGNWKLKDKDKLEN
jgi:hypothetical protein